VTVKIYFLIGFIFPLFASVANAQSESHQLSRADGSKIDFYLTKPKATQFAITLVIQGSGCDSSFSANSKPFTFGSGETTARLDIEKYGINATSKDCTPEFLKHNRISQRISDHLQVIAKLRNETWWNGRLYIVGGSEGGIVGGALAALIPETKAVGLMSSPLGSTMAQSWLKVRERQFRKDGMSDGEIKAALTQIQNQFRTMRANPTAELNYEGEANTYFWWADILDFGTYNLLLETNVPILFFQGDQDEMSDVDAARQLSKLFVQAGKTNLTYREMAGMGHTFIDQSGKSHLGEVVAEILQFFGQH